MNFAEAGAVALDDYNDCEKEHEALNAIATLLDLDTVWSVDVPSDQLARVAPFNAAHVDMQGYLSLGATTQVSVTVSLPVAATWLDLWIAADQCYRLLANTFAGGDHRFIEDFEIEGDTLHVCMGS